jgi:hypothetical protein
MAEPVKILGDITDVMLGNFGMVTGGAKPGSATYESQLARLVSRGGDELKGVSDPLEKIFSAVSSYIEENGMTPAMRNEHTRISEAVGEGRKLSRFNELYHESRDYGEVLRGSGAPTVPSAPVATEPTSRLRGTLAGETPPAPAAPPAPVDPEPTSRLRGTLAGETPPAITSADSYSRPGSITMRKASMVDTGHINSPKYAPKVSDMNINHGWKIHGDLVADLTKEEAYAKMGLEPTHNGARIVDQKAFDAFNSRLSNLGIDLNNTPDKLGDFADSFTISRKVESLGRAPSTMVNGRPAIGIEQFKHSYSNPLDTLSMMEVFHENQTQYKASAIYREGRSFTGYAQTIENRDKIITDLEQRLGDRLQDVDQKILGGHQTEGATQLSKKITGRFTTEYTDIPSPGGTMDWSSQNPAASKGQAAIDNVMATNPEMRPYIHTGVIDDQSAANLQKLTDDFPVFNEMLHGPNGYVSPYGTIEDSFSQQGYDYKTGKAITQPTATTTPVNPTTPQSAVATETYDHAADVSKATTTGESLVESPPPKPTGTVTSNAPVSQRKLDALEEMAANGSDAEKEIARKKLEELRRSGRAPRTGPGDLGRPTNIRTTPSAHGADVAAPHAGATATTTAADVVAEVTTDAPKVKVTAPPSSAAPPKTTNSLLDDAAEAARNVARGHGNARTLGIVGAATLLGVGYASTRSKKSVQRDSGTYMDESRRRLGY